MEQVREVMRVRHYAIRTEQAYCDWIRPLQQIPQDEIAGLEFGHSFGVRR
jgi:hypothetical protein